MANMHLQLKKFWQNMEKHAQRRHGYETNRSSRRGLVNNNAWWSTKATFLDVLKYLGSGIRIGAMLSRDTYVIPMVTNKQILTFR